MCFVQVEIVLHTNQNKNNFTFVTFTRTHNSTKNQLSNLGLIEETMDLSRILLAVLYIFWQSQTYFGCMAQAVCQFLQRGQY